MENIILTTSHYLELTDDEIQKPESMNKSRKKKKEKKSKKYKRKHSRSSSESSSEYSLNKKRKNSRSTSHPKEYSISENKSVINQERKSKWTTVEDENLEKDKKLINVKEVIFQEKPKEKLIVQAPIVNQNIKPELKYCEPPDKVVPLNKLRIYILKDTIKKGKNFLIFIDIVKIDEKSFYLIGKDESLADILTNHPSCSRQHAIIQHRKDGNIIKSSIIDLKSTNGTLLNKQKLVPGIYTDIKPFDVLNFGHSTRDYIIMIE